MDYTNDINTLGLQWPVTISPKPNSVVCQVTTENQSHQITVDRYSIDDQTRQGYSVRHELCHCHLAETVDTCMATLHFGHQAPKDVVMAVYFIWAPIDIWVNRLRHQHWPEDTQVEHDSHIKELGLLTEHKPHLINDNAELLITSAMFKTEARWYDTGDIRKIFRKLYPGTLDMVKALERVMRDMLEDEATVPNLQRYMRRFAGVFDFPELANVELRDDGSRGRHRLFVV